MERVTYLILSLSIILTVSLILPTDSLAKIRMFGSSSSGGTGNPSNFYEVDPATGAVALIGPIGFNRVGAMATHPTTNVIYATAERASDSASVFITINPITGEGREQFPTGIPSDIMDMTFRSDETVFLHLQTFRTGDAITEIYATTIPGAPASPQRPLGGLTFIGDTGVNGSGGGLAMTDTDHHPCRLQLYRRHKDLLLWDETSSLLQPALCWRST